MDWNALVGLGGLIVAALSVVIGYLERIAERSAAHRQVIYQKQIEAYQVALTATEKLVDKAIDLLPADLSCADDSMRKKLLKATKAEYEAAAEAADAGLLFFSSAVQEKFEEFDATWIMMTMNNWPTKEFQSPPAVELIGKLENVMLEARAAIGVEPLSREIRKLVGERAKRSALFVYDTDEP